MKEEVEHVLETRIILLWKRKPDTCYALSPYTKPLGFLPGFQEHGAVLKA